MQEFDDDSSAELSETEGEESETPPSPKTDNEIEAAYTNLSFRVIYQSNNFFLPQIKNLIAAGEVINLRPEYQRRLRWPIKKKSLLIESLLLNIPIPSVFFYESDLARYEVMDGQQRLNAIHDFLENNFALTGLEKLDFLNGKRYKVLPPKLQRSLDRASISAIVLLQETKSEKSDPFLVRRYVFERLNTGGEKLNPQELRNSLYQGPFNELIVKLARNDTFCKIFGIPQYTETDENEYYENPARQQNSYYRNMHDCQIVLRFFSLMDDVYIKGAMQNILEKCMERNENIPTERLDQFKGIFEALIEACYKIFDDQTFRLPKGRISIALYDSIMVALYRRFDKLDFFIANKKSVQVAVGEALKSKFDLLTGRVNTAQSIKDRITEIGGILDNVFKGAKTGSDG